MDETPILVDKHDGYRVITLNRPQRLNAFTIPMHQVLASARSIVAPEYQPAPRKLGDYLVEQGLITAAQLEEALAELHSVQAKTQRGAIEELAVVQGKLASARALADVPIKSSCMCRTTAWIETSRGCCARGDRDG